MIGWEFYYTDAEGVLRFAVCTNMHTDIKTGAVTVTGSSLWGEEVVLPLEDVSFEKESGLNV